MALYLLDITRIISRIGRGFATGIDRVEMAYLSHCTDGNPQNLFVARVGARTVLIDRQAALGLLQHLASPKTWERPLLTDALRFKINWEQRCARSFLKRRALGDVPNSDVSKLFSAIDLTQFEYLNVGHSNLTEDMFSALKQHNCAKIRVLIHDMIPLDHPEFSQSHIPKTFERRMRTVASHADQIICNSAVTQQRVQRYFDSWGAQPKYLIAHLGIEPMACDSLGKRFDEHPYFVILGTIEPRKNHQLLFRVWEELAKKTTETQMPRLYVVGRRGWDNIEAFKFLDQSKLVGRSIIETNNLDDAKLANLLGDAKALLFPSLVEGFGLPALEAAQLGVPIICSDLDIFKEILGAMGTYLDPHSMADWLSEIENNTKKSPETQQNVVTQGDCVKIPTWESHFGHVFG